MYESELRDAFHVAIDRLKAINGFVLYSFNIWTDPGAGVSAFSADTRAHSDSEAAALRIWMSARADEAEREGNSKRAKLLRRPIDRNCNPAGFLFRDIYIVTHSDWDNTIGPTNGWDVVERVLLRIRDEAAILLPKVLAVENDAEISIASRKDWYDLAVPIRQASSR